MAKEVDINAEPEAPKKEPIGTVVDPSNFNWDDWEIYQTDVNLHFTFLGNPIYWLRLRILWGEFDGYGFVLGPFVLNLKIHRLIRLKEK